jgi:ABC-type sugar transport system ATPase subunit
MARIDLVNVCKTLGDGKAPAYEVMMDAARAGARTPDGGGRATFSIQDLNLTVPDGKTLVVLGPSGCGKTTLLKLIAGLIAPDSGAVRYDGVDVKDVTPGDRRIGMVFQNYALYPHFTSRTNVLSYFLFRKKTPELDALARAKYQRTSELMGVDLQHLLDRKPTGLSGGEKQRVALGRCITRDAAIFLVDEPFANLDQALREKYRVNLKLLLQQFSITTVYVTHDHHEALILADLLAIMDRGRIEQVGSYADIYDRPQNLFVAGFLNRHVGTPPLSLLDAGAVRPRTGEGDVAIGVRPEDVDVSVEERPGARSAVVTSKLSLPMNSAAIVTARMGGDELHAYAADDPRLVAGARVWLGFTRYHVFDRRSGRRLRSHPEPR